MSRSIIFAKSAVLSGGKVLDNAYIEVSLGRIARISHMCARKPDISADIALPGFIDPHVHCRDARQSHKETIRTAEEAAAHGGVTRIHDMPNSDPPVLYWEDARKRMEAARKAHILVEYAFYMGLTRDIRQAAQAVAAAGRHPEIAGLKLYAGESTGDLAVTGKDDQARIYGTLAKLGYRGVLMVHCEDTEKSRQYLWDPARPGTWSDARPPEAELSSVKLQLQLAQNAGFKGKMHICHASIPGTVSLVHNAVRSVNAGCGATPHHLLLDSGMAREARRGLMLKVNPPLRDRATVEALRKDLCAGRIRWIESDHAPHLREEKLKPPYMSGVPGLDIYAGFAAFMHKKLHIALPQIANLTSQNAAALFGLRGREIRAGSHATMTLIDMKPETITKKSIRSRCGWSPYEGLEFPGRCRATIVNGHVAYDANA